MDLKMQKAEIETVNVEFNHPPKVEGGLRRASSIQILSKDGSWLVQELEVANPIIKRRRTYYRNLNDAYNGVKSLTETSSFDSQDGRLDAWVKESYDTKGEIIISRHEKRCLPKGPDDPELEVVWAQFEDFSPTGKLLRRATEAVDLNSRDFMSITDTEFDPETGQPVCSTGKKIHRPTRLAVFKEKQEFQNGKPVFLKTEDYDLETKMLVAHKMVRFNVESGRLESETKEKFDPYSSNRISSEGKEYNPVNGRLIFHSEEKFDPKSDCLISRKEETFDPEDGHLLVFEDEEINPLTNESVVRRAEYEKDPRGNLVTKEEKKSHDGAFVSRVRQEFDPKTGRETHWAREVGGDGDLIAAMESMEHDPETGNPVRRLKVNYDQPDGRPSSVEERFTDDSRTSRLVTFPS